MNVENLPASLSLESAASSKGRCEKMIQLHLIPKDREHDERIQQDESLWATHNVHDPSICKDGDWYYVFSTDAQEGGTFKAGIQIRKSKDLVNWQWVGRAFSELPVAAERWTGAPGLWAPEITKLGDTYYLYYAASQFGRNQSFIGVATSKQIEGPWFDRGEVVKTEQGEGPNAIDPNITFDAQGDPWMVYGSFFDGIFLARIDHSTGKFVEEGKGKLIASRHSSVEGAIEGPYIVYNPHHDYYYLFVSYDSLFSSYHIRVARSKQIEGPYIDSNGHEMTNTELPPNDVGMKVLGSYQFDGGPGWVAPGHNSILKDQEDYYVVHHIRVENKKGHYLHIRKIGWTEDGWPLVSPQRFAGEQEKVCKMDDLLGNWECIYFDKDSTSKVNALRRCFSTHSNDANGYTIELHTNNHFTLTSAHYPSVDGMVMSGWDWEKSVETIVFMGKDKEGNVVLGKRII